MPVMMRGFSLLEVLISMAISSILLLGASRFLPALQRGILEQTRQQALEDEIWQRLYTVAKHLQRAGYCNGQQCGEEPLLLARQGRCVIVRWDANSDGVWQTTPATNADSTGFRLQNGVLETLRGAASCEGKGWDKMTDPEVITVIAFRVTRQNNGEFSPSLFLDISAASASGKNHVSAHYSVTGYNL